MEDIQQSVQAEASDGMWGPQELGSIKQANKMVTSNHGPAYSPKNENWLGTKNMMASMTMLKRMKCGLWIQEHPIMSHSVTKDVGTKEMQLV
jgi:hypothetical protein